jgi:hypothetical protein
VGLHLWTSLSGRTFLGAVQWGAIAGSYYLKDQIITFIQEFYKNYDSLKKLYKNYN